MRRKSWAAVVLAALLLLSGCKQSGLETNIGQAFANISPEDEQVRHDDIVQYDSPDFEEKVGIRVVSYLETADIYADRFYSIDDWFGQIEYRTSDERLMVLRIARDTSRDLKKGYSEKHVLEMETRTAAGLEITTAASVDGCHLSSWTQDGIQYTLHTSHLYKPPTKEEVDLIAFETVGEIINRADLAPSSEAGSGA